MTSLKATRAGNRTKWLFLLPGFFIYCAIIVLPALYSLYLSLFKWNGVSPVKKFVGLSNYVNLVTKDAVFKIAFRNNLIWMLLSICVTITAALLFALLINRRFFGRTLIRSVLYFPYILSGIVVSIIWSWVYHPQMGLLNAILNALGLESRALLANTSTALISVYVASFWHSVGQPMILFLAGLQTIPYELTEAARIDGANRVQTFFAVTLPMLGETFFIVFATQVIQSFKIYDMVRAMTGGGPAQSTQTLATWMITQTFTFTNIGTGTAIAWCMVLVLMVIVIPYAMVTAKE